MAADQETIHPAGCDDKDRASPGCLYHLVSPGSIFCKDEIEKI